MFKPLHFGLVFQLSVATQGWMEFGRHPNARPVLQRKRVLGLEHVQSFQEVNELEVNNRILEE